MKRLIIFLFVFIAVPFVAFAADTDSEKYSDCLSMYDFSFFEETLDEDTYELIEKAGLSDFDYDTITSLDFGDVLSFIKSAAENRIKAPVKGALSVIAYIIISALIKGMKPESGTSMSDTFSTASALITAVLLTGSIGKTITLCTESLKIAGDFIYAFIPVFCAIIIASGNAFTSFSTNSMLLILAQGLSFISSNLFMPLINCFLAIGICSGIRSELRLERLITSLRSVLIWSFSFLSGAFVSVLSIKTTVAGKADILGIRSARFVINSVVPVIGGTISEGLLSIQAYSSLIKSSVGIVGIVAVALVFLPSVLEIMMWRFVIALCGLIADTFNDSSVSLILGTFRDALLLANVVLVLSAVTTVISIGLLIAAGG